MVQVHAYVCACVCLSMSVGGGGDITRKKSSSRNSVTKFQNI